MIANNSLMFAFFFIINTIRLRRVGICTLQANKPCVQIAHVSACCCEQVFNGRVFSRLMWMWKSYQTVWCWIFRRNKNKLSHTDSGALGERNKKEEKCVKNWSFSGGVVMHWNKHGFGARQKQSKISRLFKHFAFDTSILLFTCTSQ